ncbi:unnamed protein product, partial [Vitis vinifera]
MVVVIIAIVLVKGLLFVEDAALLGALPLEEFVVDSCDGDGFSRVRVVVMVEEEDGGLGLVLVLVGRAMVVVVRLGLIVRDTTIWVTLNL